MNNVEKIRKACVEENPEIVELKLGCLAEIGLIMHFVTGYDSAYVYTRPIDRANEQYHFSLGYLQKHHKIIGRPIRLADVLLAIKDDRIMVDIHGCFMRNHVIGVTSVMGMHRWNLKQDDLEKQSPETLDFIASLLT